MLVSFVVRLVSDVLVQDGELLGEIERVATGERAQFRGADDLIRVCRDLNSSASAQSGGFVSPRG